MARFHRRALTSMTSSTRAHITNYPARSPSPPTADEGISSPSIPCTGNRSRPLFSQYPAGPGYDNPRSGDDLPVLPHQGHHHYLRRAENLADRRDIHVDPEVDRGFRSLPGAMVLTLRALRADRTTCCSRSPYVGGITGAARLGLTFPRPVGEDTSCRRVRAFRSDGKRAAGVLRVPDVANPSV